MNETIIHFNIETCQYHVILEELWRLPAPKLRKLFKGLLQWNSRETIDRVTRAVIDLSQTIKGKKLPESQVKGIEKLIKLWNQALEKF